MDNLSLSVLIKKVYLFFPRSSVSLPIYLHLLTCLIYFFFPYRRLASNEFPPQLSIVSITRGKVLFCVDDEFEASLTVMGDTASFPCRLLDVEILVDDLETADGKALVHSLQVGPRCCVSGHEKTRFQ